MQKRQVLAIRDGIAFAERCDLGMLDRFKRTEESIDKHATAYAFTISVRRP